MRQKKQISYFWLYNILPEKISSLLQLIRFEKPIGFFLLMWPCWFALALFSVKEIKWYILFFFGSFFMRSAGCIINDYFDRFIDIKIERTSKRPLTSGAINSLEAFLFMVLLLFFSLLILINFNIMAIIVSLASLPLILIYPLMKRFTNWPQLILGVTFSWGIFISAAQFQHIYSLETLILYLGCIFWTLGYDTIYAYQDRMDDIKINLKSTAILFGNNGKYLVMIFYSLFILSILILNLMMSLSFINSIILIMILISLLFFLSKWNMSSKKSCENYFKYNNYLGLIIFLYLITSSNV